MPRRREARASATDPTPAGPGDPAARGRRTRGGEPPRAAARSSPPASTTRSPTSSPSTSTGRPSTRWSTSTGPSLPVTPPCSAPSCCRRSRCCTPAGSRTSTSSRRTSSCATAGRSSSTSAPRVGWAADSLRGGRSAPWATRLPRWRPANRCPQRWTCSGSAPCSPRRSPALPFTDGPRLPRSRLGQLTRRLLDDDPATRGSVGDVLMELAEACGARRPWPVWLDARARRAELSPAAVKMER